MPDEDPKPKRTLAEMVASIKGDTLDSTGGRPSKRSPYRVDKIVQALRLGATRKSAAEFNGIHRNTLNNWISLGLQEFDDAMAEDREPTGDFFNFLCMVREAEAEVELRMTKRVSEDGEKDWRAALEWLKRRRRADWGDSLDVTKLTTEQLLEIYAESEAE